MWKNLRSRKASTKVKRSKHFYIFLAYQNKSLKPAPIWSLWSVILLLYGTDSSWRLHHSFSLFLHWLRYHVNNASYPLFAFRPLIWTAFLSFHCCLISCVACRYRLSITYLGWAWVGCQVAHNSRCCAQSLLPGRRLAREQQGHRDWHSYSNADIHFKALPAYMTRSGSSCQMIRVSARCCTAPCPRVYSQNMCVSADNSSRVKTRM